MLWTLVAFLGIVSILLVQFLTSLIGKIKDTYFIYPSDAVIDQVLPMEIMEHMTTFLDPHGLMQCRFVSKYWRYHANKKSAEQIVMSNYDNNTLKELPFAHSQAKPTKTEFRDRAVAGAHDRILLSVDESRLSGLEMHFDSQNPDAANYAVKTTMTKSDRDFSFHSQHDIVWSELNGTPPTNPVHDTRWEDTPHFSRAEVIFDLADYLNVEKRQSFSQTLYSYRNLGAVKYFWFVPLDGQFLQVLLVILAPLIVRDVLFTPSFLQVVNQWLGPVTFIASFLLNVIILRNSVRYAYHQFRPFTKIPMVGFMILYVALTWWTYPYSSRYFVFISLVGFSFVYVILIYDYTFVVNRGARPYRRFGPLITAAVLVLVMNDWKLAVECIRDGSIWMRAFDNSVLYAILMLNFIVLNFFSYYAKSTALQWSHFLEWEPSAIGMLSRSYLFVVLFALYAPSWKGNHV